MLTVTAATLQSIAVTPANPSIAKGQTEQFTATGTYSDGTMQNLTNSVTWASSNTTAATISSTGLATAANVGTSTISATSGSVVGSTMLTVVKATPVVSWNMPASIVYGTALGSGQLNATANVPGTFTYNPPAGTVLPVGTNEALSVSFTPTDTTNYNSGSGATTITVTSASNGSAPNLIVTKVLSRDNNNNVVVTLTIANNGGTTAANVSVTSVKVGSTTGTPLPQSVGSIAASSSASAMFTIPNSAGLASGSASSLTASGTYTGGTFSSSSRVTLP
jgi:hypothetical protein